MANRLIKAGCHWIRLTKARGEPGQTFVELLVATFLVSVTLVAVLSTFIGGRDGLVVAWQRSKENGLAVELMEQIKARPYSDLLDWERRFRVDGRAVRLNPKDPAIHLQIDPKYQGYQMEFDLLPYEHFSKEDLMQVIVRVRDPHTQTWVIKASLVRNGERPQ